MPTAGPLSGAGCRGQSRGPDPGDRAAVPCRETGRAERSWGAGRPCRGDSAARSTGLRPVFPVPLPPPRVLVCAGVARGAGRRHPWTGGAAAAGGGTPKEGVPCPPRPAATAPPLWFSALLILPLSSPPGGEAGTCGGSPPRRGHAALARAPQEIARLGGSDHSGPGRGPGPGPSLGPSPSPSLGPALGTDAPVASRSGTTGQSKAQSQRQGASGTSAPAAGRSPRAGEYPRGISSPRSRALRRFSPARQVRCPPAPPVPRGRCFYSPPRSRAAATSCPASSRSFVCFGFSCPLAGAPRARFAAFVRGIRTRRAPRGPPAGSAPATHLGGANSRAGRGSTLLLTGLSGSR